MQMKKTGVLASITVAAVAMTGCAGTMQFRGVEDPNGNKIKTAEGQDVYCGMRSKGSPFDVNYEAVTPIVAADKAAEAPVIGTIQARTAFEQATGGIMSVGMGAGAGMQGYAAIKAADAANIYAKAVKDGALKPVGDNITVSSGSVSGSASNSGAVSGSNSSAKGGDATAVNNNKVDTDVTSINNNALLNSNELNNRNNLNNEQNQGQLQGQLQNQTSNLNPTVNTTVSPTISPTISPVTTSGASATSNPVVNNNPTISPTISPTVSPTISPTTTVSPTISPTISPTTTVSPTISPTITANGGAGGDASADNTLTSIRPTMNNTGLGHGGDIVINP